MVLLYILLIISLVITGVYIYRRLSSRNAAQEKRHDLKPPKLMSVLLKLDKHDLDELLKLYRAEFGKGAARYARATHKKWRTGEVRANSQTYERFLVHLPKVMSFEMKCEILRHFMEEYASKDHHELNVTAVDWDEKLTPLIKQIIDKAFTAQLPLEVERKLKWLVDGDMQIAAGILRASQAEEGRIMVSMLKQEFIQFEKILDNKTIRPRLSHELKFPYGTIKLNIKKV